MYALHRSYITHHNHHITSYPNCSMFLTLNRLSGKFILQRRFVAITGYLLHYSFIVHYNLLFSLPSEVYYR